MHKHGERAVCGFLFIQFWSGAGRPASNRIIKNLLDKGKSMKKKNFDREFWQHIIPFLMIWDAIKELLGKGKQNGQNKYNN